MSWCVSLLTGSVFNDGILLFIKFRDRPLVSDVQLVEFLRYFTSQHINTIRDIYSFSKRRNIKLCEIFGLL